MVKIQAEMTALAHAAERATAAVAYSVDKDDAVQRLSKLTTRMQLLQQVLQEHVRTLHMVTAQPVPITYFGVGQEVKVMGSFDNWTNGVALSAEDITDNVLTEFRGELMLIPGEYQLKLLVDGQWRLAADWPTVLSGDQTNNLLVVE
jgi:hypothetical protein